ncbi:MAG TPA: 16S rRNA (cytosine(1402)-N(4))-methyltransferase RsmH [Nitrospirota bacterium]|nr:16S rRNA (cytosine(1402)-N(4))-methyltransferase RsmH [Nitrospirota bacterium]
MHLSHRPVLRREAVDWLSPKPGGVYVDGTLGAGGHAMEILKQSEPDGKLIGMDQDAEAVTRCKMALASYGERVFIRQANFQNIGKVLSEAGYLAVDGVLLDLGISWYHLKTPERGFSFMLDGPLDMRMDRSSQQTAADLVNTLPRNELAKILFEYGEESRAGAIARAIEKARISGPITSTLQLAEIISSVFPPYSHRRIHPATLTFQALRIAVNDEMGALNAGLDQIITHMKSGARLVVITFHSLEDRIVKQTFARAANDCICPPKMPVCSCGKKPELTILTRRPIKAGPEELEVNPSARSAKLRAAEKI